MKEEIEILESAGKNLIKQRVVAAAQKGFTGLILTGGFIFLFFLVKPLANWGDLRISDFGILCFKVAGVGMAIVATFIISSALTSFLKMPKAPMSSEQTCRQFYFNLVAHREFDERYLCYVCLTISAKQEYGGIDQFLKKWSEWKKKTKGFLFDHIDVECQRYHSQNSICTVTVKFKKFQSENVMKTYVCRPNLQKIGERWYIDTPTTDCVPVVSNEIEKQKAQQSEDRTC